MDVKDQKIRSKYLTKLPALIFMDRRGNETAKVVGKTSARVLLNRLKKLYRAHFQDRMTTRITSYSKWLDSVETAEDQLANAQKALTSAQARDDQRSTPQTKRRIAKFAKVHKTAAQAFKHIMNKEAKLKSPPLKSESVAAK